MARRSFDFGDLFLVVVVPVAIIGGLYDSLGPLKATLWLVGIVGGCVLLAWWMRPKIDPGLDISPPTDAEYYAERSRLECLRWCPQCRTDALGWDHPTLDGSPDMRFKTNGYRCRACGWTGEGESDAVKQNIANEQRATQTAALEARKKLEHYLNFWPEAEAFRAQPLHALVAQIDRNPAPFTRLPARTQALIAAAWARIIDEPRELQELPCDMAASLRCRLDSYLAHVESSGSPYAGSDQAWLRSNVGPRG